MSLSVRGIARHFLERRGRLSVAQVFFDDAVGGSLRERLAALARQEISFEIRECIYANTARYQQTWSHVHVRVQLVPDAGISSATMNMLQGTWASAIVARWSNRFGIGHAGEATCPITFDVEWATSNPHHVVRVQVGPARSNAGLWDTADTGDVAAHEFGHLHGNLDEYADAACPDRSPVGTGTVMDNNSDVVATRFVQRLADNVGSGIV
jgi:hypothetical protein